MAVRVWEVGGHVRDSLLGIQSKDIDIAVEASGWEEMREFVAANTKKIFLEKPEFLTIRAMGMDGLPKDFVLCRKDGDYSDGRRPDSVEPGTILDDLRRRDFTVNAIARDPETGEIFDPFDGMRDLEAMELRCVGSAEERFAEDALRILRALRFWVTKGFAPKCDIFDIFKSEEWADHLSKVSPERTREELLKCFQHNTSGTMQILVRDFHPAFAGLLFSKRTGIWLKPTMEDK